MPELEFTKDVITLVEAGDGSVSPLLAEAPIIDMTCDEFYGQLAIPLTIRGSSTKITVINLLPLTIRR